MMAETHVHHWRDDGMYRSAVFCDAPDCPLGSMAPMDADLANQYEAVAEAARELNSLLWQPHEPRDLMIKRRALNVALDLLGTR